MNLPTEVRYRPYADWTDTGAHAVPPEWKIIYYDKTEDKYFTTKTKEEECDKYGNPLGAARMKLFTRKQRGFGNKIIFH